MVDISNVIAGSISEFIDYALWLTTIMIIYYAIKFAIGTDKKEEPTGEGWEKVKEWFKTKAEKDKEKKESKKTEEEKEKDKATRERLMQHVIRFFVGAEGHAQQAKERIKDIDHHKALLQGNQRIDSILRNLNSTKRNFAGAQLKATGNRRKYIRKLAAYVQTIEQRVNQAKLALPIHILDPIWSTKINISEKRLDEVIQMCGYVHDAVEEFIKDDKMADPTEVPAGTPIIPSPTPPRS